MKVGILALADPGKGLWRDTEILIWALQSSTIRRRNNGSSSISIFTIERYDSRIRNSPENVTSCALKQSNPYVVRMGTQFNNWLEKLDVLICNEVWLENVFQLARKAKVRVIYVPNLDCATTNGGTSSWIKSVRKSTVEIWAKTKFCQKVLNETGIKSNLVLWSIPDLVRRDREIHRKKPVDFLVIAGRGGIKNRRGIDLALKAYALARKQDQNITLTIHSIKPLKKYVPPDLLNVEGLSISEGLLARQDLAKFYDHADVLLYPTRWDGFGLSLLEALHEGLPVITTDGQPMNELVEHEHNGLLVEAEKNGVMKLTPNFECSARAMANAIIRIANDDILRDRLTCPEPSAWIARQSHFCLRVQQLVQQENMPRVAIFMKKATSQGARRSEEYWRDALCCYGYNAALSSFEDATPNIEEYLRDEIEFILVSKVSQDFLKKIRQYNSAPIILWHHDISDYSKQRWAWFKSVAPMCDLVAVPESGREIFKSLPNNIVQVFPGVKIDGDRGPGLRPRRMWRKWKQDTIVFLGNNTSPRTLLFKALAKQFRVIVYGDNINISLKSVEIRPSIWGEDALNAIRKSMMVLSTSMRNDYFYTSNRLFNCAGAGGGVLVQSFPHLRKLYPKNCLIEFNNSKDMVIKADKLARNQVELLRMRIEAENYTWRHHTWLDRIGEILGIIKKSNIIINAGKLKTDQSNRAIHYWNNRADNFGVRSTGYFKWGSQQFNEYTDKLWTKLAWYLKKHLKNSDSNLIDFGCGTGRFLDRLNGFGFNVFGLDISRSMLNLAQKNCRKELHNFAQIDPYNGLPFKKNSISILWSCTVLQHVHDDLFDGLINELRRILKPDGLVLLFENTYKHTARTSTSGHMVFREPSEYLAAFPGISEVDCLKIEGEDHTVFAGRISKQKMRTENFQSTRQCVQKTKKIKKSKITIVYTPSEVQSIYVDETIPRLTPANEVKILCWLIKQGTGNVVEIGCNKGLTTRDLAILNPEKIIYAVDYLGADSCMSQEQKREKPKAENLCIFARDLWNVVCINKNSAELNYESLNNIKFIFIDGDHSYKGVKEDTEKALKYLCNNSGGILVWHDYYEEAPNWIGVKEYVNSLGIEVEHIKGTRLALTKIKAVLDHC